MTALTTAERRLGLASLGLGLLAVLWGLLAAARLLQSTALGVPGLLGTGVCLLLVALEPRHGRPLGLPVLAMLGAAAVSAPDGGQRVVWGAAALLVGGLLEGARRSVHGSWLRGGPSV